ncbi:RagB/SusD family nutrient uptake outer membrane protein [Algoriphagus zhangzhouensis]|uniref:Starch-binding associating with outer membrane n=1 Tax=Algoriphagus zhangzhouensis TaxID=1073327 RepID=A0A1M7Z7U1_9BACT|nr:RagB/SusD family nutrient uptake outer membrane protein [Algoriphagus zhangzhouensis]TDY49478.1 putative outer membrane starch-binding protein [Algoriphagus zhangzhouensis]SHO61003.1 Starch-binding associating with outer membrane [Algoriphagus zhangzhouensis]
MKNIKYLFILSLTFFLTSCMDEFLKESPVDRYVVGNFYSSQSDAEAAVTAAYAKLFDIYERNMFILCDLPADTEKNGLGMPNQFLQNLEYLRHTSQNQFAREMWLQNYSAIARANTAIINIPTIEMDETVKARLVSEAKFLRALFYFNLVRFYGDVPLVTKLESVNDALVARSPVEDVYSLIISDLQDAESNLPVSYAEKDMGRATKGAAKILLGKVYLTRHEFSKASEKLAEVINNEGEYGYGLHENFRDNWNAATENGKEMVFSIEFMDPPGNGNAAMVLQGPKYSLPGGFAVLGLVNSNEADIPTRDLYDRFDNDDQRKAGTFRKDFVSLIDGSIHTSTIPIFTKYWEENETNPNNSDANMHVIRYADAILMYAEALNEIGQSSLALVQVNRIIERAHQSPDYNESTGNQDELREIIYEERHKELAMEGHRWFDLVRTGRFVERMKDHAAYEAGVAESNKVEIAQNIGDHMILMPIPQREIDLNPLLTQNPGY